MNTEKEPVSIEAKAGETDRKSPFLIHALVEFEIEALDDGDTEEVGRAVLDQIIKAHKDAYLRIKDAKVVDPHTGYIFRKH